MNCAYCLHFSPLSDEKFLDIKEYEADIKRLSFLFGGVAQEIRLMGGEPLLNPHIADFIRITREHFLAGAISIVTNALLLSKMPEDFWQAAKECKAIIRPSFYPIKGMDYSEGEALAKAHGVEYKAYNSEIIKNKGEMVMRKKVYDLNGCCDPRKSFTLCYEANSAITLRNGRIFTCPEAAHAEILIKRFNLDMKVLPTDSIDIYEAKSGQEILEFVAKPIPFCRYCDTSNSLDNIPWRLSEKSLSEWT